MKKLLFPILATVLLEGALTSCSDDDDNTPVNVIQELYTDFGRTGLSFKPDGVWSDFQREGALEIGDFTFSHVISEWQTVNGFVASRSTETSFHDPMYLSPYCYQVCGGKGMTGAGTPFLVAFWNSSEAAQDDEGEHSCEFRLTNNTEFSPMLIYVNNTSYAYYYMLNGDAFGRKFEEGDYFRLVIHGVASDGTEKSVSFNLADIKDSENVEAGIISRCTPVDLRSIGLVSYLYFTMESNVANQYGLTVPTYFALGGISVGQVVSL